jgi:hypothetical protein
MTGSTKNPGIEADREMVGFISLVAAAPANLMMQI